MTNWYYNESDLTFNADYGDLEIIGNDLSKTNKNINILKNVVRERVKTSFGDFMLDETYGANIAAYLGRGVDNVLKEDIVTSIRYCLTYDGLLNNNEINIVPIIIGHTIKVFIYLLVEGFDSILLASVFNENNKEIIVD